MIASLVPDLGKSFREAHYELARMTQVRFHTNKFSISSIIWRFQGAALHGIGPHCLSNRADETFGQAMTYLYLKSQSDDKIREEVNETFPFPTHSFCSS